MELRREEKRPSPRRRRIYLKGEKFIVSPLFLPFPRFRNQERRKISDRSFEKATSIIFYEIINKSRFEKRTHARSISRYLAPNEHTRRVNSFSLGDNWFVPISSNAWSCMKSIRRRRGMPRNVEILLDARDTRFNSFLLAGYVAPVSDGLRGRHKRSCPAICRCALSRNRGRAYSSRWDTHIFFHFLLEI